MQRWILAGVGMVLLMVVGALLGYQQYKASRPHPMWVPLPVNPELPMAKQEEAARDLKSKLDKPEILLKVCQDLGLRAKWELGSDDQAVAELQRRLFVRTGDAATPMGNVPAIHVGITGRNRESQLSGEIAMRLMDDVWKVLGIEPPKKPAQ